MSRTLISLSLLGLGLALGTTASAQLSKPPPPEAAPTPAETPAAPPSASAPAVPSDEDAQTVFRHDLINLVILSADGRKLAAAAQIAAPDAKDATRSEQKKTPGLIRRALQFAPNDPLVLWIAASNPCLSKPGCADPAALKTLQASDADNAAVWLRAFPTDGNAARAQSLVARMAQAQRYDDYWAADVVALYHVLETLPVPAVILQTGMSTQGARVNFASSMASAILPPELKLLGKFCGAVDAAKEEAVAANCLAVAKKLETSGTFISQSIGFAIEEHLATGTDREVMAARQRSAAWQKEQFLELAARFNREPALAESYIRLLGSEQNELAAVAALMREQKLHTDPPAGWQPPRANKADPLQDPAAQR